MEIFKELSKKGYKHYYEGTIEELDLMDKNNSDLHSEIMQVIMWLYEKHEYWCYTYTNGKIWYPCIQHKFGDMAVLSGKIGEFNSPTEAYEAAITYVLTKLI